MQDIETLFTYDKTKTLNDLYFIVLAMTCEQAKPRTVGDVFGTSARWTEERLKEIREIFNVATTTCAVKEAFVREIFTKESFAPDAAWRNKYFIRREKKFYPKV